MLVFEQEFARVAGCFSCISSSCLYYVGVRREKENKQGVNFDYV